MKHYPKISFLIPTYNQELYVEDAIMGAFAQDYQGEMEIIIADDASKDNTWEIIQQTITKNKSSFDVHAFRNEQNLGIGGNVARLCSHATGDIFIFAAGDDISYSHRVSVVVEKIRLTDDLYLLDSNYDFLCNNAIITNSGRNNQYSLQHLLNKTIELNGCARAIRRTIIDSFPPIHKNCPTEDSVFVLRALLLGNGKISAAIIDKALIKYRIHDSQVSSAQNIRKINRKYIAKQYFIDIKYAIKARYISIRYFVPLIIYVARYYIAAMLQFNKIWRKLRGR